jgi:trans-aconitate methyltransferase
VSGGFFKSVVPDDGYQPPAIDTSVAHQARVYNYTLGGKDNFPADREAAEKAMKASPDVVATARANRAFLGRAVRYLAADAGIRQFLDIGTGIPSAGNTHEVAQAAAPGSRIVYVDNDPIVLAHARALLTSAPGGETAYLDADARDPVAILAQAAGTLDFGQPVAIMMLLILHVLDDPYAVTSRLLDAVPPGSYLTVSVPASDIAAKTSAAAARRVNENMPGVFNLLSRAEVAGFFDGLELLEPGIVPANHWRPGPGGPEPARDLPCHVGVARKP